MRLRTVVFALLLALPAAAQTTLNLEQLLSFVRSSLQLHHPDKQIGAFLKNVKLTERLEDSVIEDLLASGAGPKTVEALKALATASAELAKPKPKVVAAPPAPIPPPSSEDQAKALDEAKEFARGYVKSLPDFICTQVTRRYYDPTGMEFWSAADTLTARLTYFENKEDYKLTLINGQYTTQSYYSLGGATSTGEFGSLLRELFDERTRTKFEWERWATLRGRRTHVFSYRVEQANSKWTIDYERRESMIAAYRGNVFVDRDTGMVLRVSLEAVDIPPAFPVQQATTTLDYDFQKIGDREFLLPLRALIRLRHDKFLSKNDVEFRMYRKFAADTTITFDTPAPLADDQVKEQPPK